MAGAAKIPLRHSDAAEAYWTVTGRKVHGLSIACRSLSRSMSGRPDRIRAILLRLAARHYPAETAATYTACVSGPIAQCGARASAARIPTAQSVFPWSALSVPAASIDWRVTLNFRAPKLLPLMHERFGPFLLGEVRPAAQADRAQPTGPSITTA